jgi:hypothetical protein
VAEENRFEKRGFGKAQTFNKNNNEKEKDEFSQKHVLKQFSVKRLVSSMGLRNVLAATPTVKFASLQLKLSHSLHRALIETAL